MRKATIIDAKSLGLELNALPKASEGLLRNISEPVGASTTGKPSRKSTTTAMAIGDGRPSGSGKVAL